MTNAIVHGWRFDDLTWRRFGFLDVQFYSGKDRFGKALWSCECVCGAVVVVRSDSLKGGTTSHCCNACPVKLENDFYTSVKKVESGCMEWQGSLDKRGYGLANRGDVRRAHRCSYEMHVGSAGDLFVLHRCDNPRCVNPTHLFLGTHDDNMADCTAKGRRPKGERSGTAKLTARQVKWIILRYAAGGVSHSGLAREYMVSDSCIAAILQGRKWQL